MTRHEGRVGKPALPPALHEVTKRKGARGNNPTVSSQFTVDIYDVVQQAGEAGLTVREIYQVLSRSSTFDNATLLWWRERIQSEGTSIVSFDPRREGMARVKQRVNSMRTTNVLRSLGYADGRGSRYMAGRPPKGYRPKKILNPEVSRSRPWGHYDIDPAEGRSVADLERRKRTWLEDARIALKKSNPKNLRRLVEDAFAFIER